MHIIIRFELEQALLEDSLRVGDLPQAWNDAYERNLGLRPPRDADGVLQDVHWSAGLFGYFPTYSLGNIFAGQLFSQANADLGDLQDLFAQGQFAPLLQWLRAQVHRVGNRYSSRELVAKITGQPLDSQPLLNHLRSKLLPIYGL
jgi:carboxypeptidase Taq